MVGVPITKSRTTKNDDTGDSSDSDQDDSVEDNEAYLQLWKQAFRHNQQRFEQMYNNFAEDGVMVTMR